MSLTACTISHAGFFFWRCHIRNLIMPTLRCTSTILLWLLCSVSDFCLGQSLRSDTASREVIFGRESLQNTLAFVEELAGLPESMRYERLLNHVFPPETDLIHIEFV